MLEKLIELFLFSISFLFVFGILVFVHELGHFVVAKLSGVKVLEFGFGYPPAIYKKKFGETYYSINVIPFGGFVKLLGEDGSSRKDPRSFMAKSKAIRAGIISAGVLMNFVLACIIFSSLYIFGFSPLIPGMEEHKGVEKHIYIEEASAGTVAFEAGIRKGDELLKVDGQKVDSIAKSRQVLLEKSGKEIIIEIKRNSETKSFKIIPFKEALDGKEIGRIGTENSETIKINNIFRAIVTGVLETLRLAQLTIVGLFGFFGKLITKLTIGEDAVGPVGIAVLTNEVRQLGFTFLLQFMAILSISLALLNVMPIPALDGGQLFFLLIEKVKGSEISTKVKNNLTIGSFILLLVLMFIISTKDIMRFGLIDNIKKLFGF